jgi:probable rRNA maturation factor
MTIEVANESGIDVSESELISVARFVIDQMDVNPAAELSMVLLDMAAMADLHMRWMDLPGPVLCPEFASVQAATTGHTLGHELALLTIHGILHLLGYDHAEPDEAKEMFALQQRLLEEWVAEQVEAYRVERQIERDQRLLDKSRHFEN